ncbi:MAG: cytidine deaminase [Bacilli bacterium]|jgi:cytidine deaminase|nr:cytidine deaminase [Bacilli bacterium]
MEKLYSAALEAYHKSYSPYSKFAVGAALLMKDGTIISGANIENASYGLSNCAERSALFCAYSKGYQKNDILKMLIVANTPHPVSPCGACRQVIQELMPKNSDVIMCNLNKETKTVKVLDLLPFAFTEEDLK